MKQGAQIGSIQNKAQFDKLKACLEDAHARGTVITGGHVLDRLGFFIAPTIMRDIPFDGPMAASKTSGFGSENGQEGMEEYTQAHIINVVL